MSWVAIAGALIFFLGILASLALHELGHFIPAKLFGIRVTQFMVGFGKTVWSRRQGETEYGVKLIPAGGFVRMPGMFPPARDGSVRRSSTGPFQTMIEEARQQSVDEAGGGDPSRLFYARAWWRKLIVMVGGPFVNLLIAFGLFAVVFMGIGIFTPTRTVEAVPDCVLPATTTQTRCHADDPASPAKRAGFEKGDKVVAFNGTPVSSWEQLSAKIRAAGAGAATVTVERDGRPVTLHPKLIRSERADPDHPNQVEAVGYLGLVSHQVHEKQGIGDVFGQMGHLTAATGRALAHMPQRMVGVVQAAFGGADRAQNSPMSVVGASRVAGEIASYDAPISDRIASFVQWLGAVNLFLALFNFIPLLPLDGGHILGALIEGFRQGIARLFRRPDPGYVDVAKALPIAYAAASVLIVMGVLLIYADIVSPVRLTG